MLFQLESMIIDPFDPIPFLIPVLLFYIHVAHHGPWVMLPKEQPDNDVRENSPCAPQTDRESTSELIHGN
jgi:hypothetical protein